MSVVLRCMVTLSVSNTRLQQIHLVSDDSRDRIDIFINAPTGTFELKKDREYLVQFIPVLQVD